MAKKVLRVGADPFPPYQYIDERGRPRGSDFDRVTALLDKAGYEAHVMLDEWSALERGMAEGTLDALFQVQKTPARERKYFFSGLLRNAATEVITAQPELAPVNWDEIAEKPLVLGVIGGYAYGEAVDRLPESCKRPYPSQEALLEAVAVGREPLGVFDGGVRAYLSKRLGMPVYPVESLTFLRPLYIMFREAEPGARVRAVQGL